ncbi:putative ribonuclease H-like domain-containing protein [Tanacetum coccineum]|uniref:Ribonuclease H-like domain-containing protein n=1 Tax=Tanacetum coccineum TaxID=301880 RepID=A0ABQ5DEG5_9ASTR
MSNVESEKMNEQEDAKDEKEVIVNGDAPAIASVSAGTEAPIEVSWNQGCKDLMGSIKARSEGLENTSSTNEVVNTSHEVSTVSSQGQASSSTYADEVMFSLFAINLMRGHFARECRALRYQENRNGDGPRRNAPVDTSTTNAWIFRRDRVTHNISLQEQGFNSGCSRQMTGNKSFLIDYQEVDGGFVAFAGSPKGGKTTRKSKIRTGKLDFEDVYFVKELKFNLFSISQICDKKNSVLFTKTECLVLSPDFKLLDESSRNGPNWLFDIDSLTISMNYKPVVVGNQTNGNAGTKENINAGLDGKKIVPDQKYILLSLVTSDPLLSKSLKDSPDAGFKPSGEEEKINFEHQENEDSEVPNTQEPRINQEQDANVNSTNNINTVSPTVNAADIKNNAIDENIVYGCIDDPNIRNLEEIIYSDDDDDEVGAEADMNNLATTMPVSPIPTITVYKDHPLKQIIGDIQSAPQTRRMTKNVTEHGMFSSVQQRINHKDFQDCMFACFLSQVEPKKVIQALSDLSWIEAMQDELLQFKLQKVWTLVDLPYGKRAIGTKWVYKNKKDDRGIVVRNKARLVAQGYTQEEGIDYDEVFALVARIDAIRLFLAYASFMRFIVYKMDVKSAFLYGTIKEEVYVCQPPGFEDQQFPDKVYKVEKALYGLHQAPKAWYETLSTYLLANRFRRGTIDKTLFIKKEKGDILLVQVYVDDIIFGSTKKFLCVEFEQMMHKRFQMISIGELTFFLRLQVKQKDDGIFISQDKYVVDVLKKFDFATMKTANTPIETNKALLKDEEVEDVDVHLYRSMIGSLMYLTASRLDIIYLKGQPKLGLWYPKDSPFDLEAFSNSDYARASLDRKSTTGDKTIYKEWEDRMERVVTTASSLEAEQDSGNINRTQSMATLNESFPQGTDSGSGPMCQDTILRGAEAQIRIEDASK